VIHHEYRSVLHPERITCWTGGDKLILDGVGHVPQREQPVTVLDLIGAWLSRLPSPPQATNQPAADSLSG